MAEDFGEALEAIGRTDLRTSVARRGWDGLHSNRSLPELAFSVRSLCHDDLLVRGAEPKGVEEHQMTARRAFNPHGKGQVTAAVLHQRAVVRAGRKAAVIQEHRQTTYAKRIRQAAHGAGGQAEPLKRL